MPSTVFVLHSDDAAISYLTKQSMSTDYEYKWKQCRATPIFTRKPQPCSRPANAVVDPIVPSSAFPCGLHFQPTELQMKGHGNDSYAGHIRIRTQPLHLLARRPLCTPVLRRAQHGPAPRLVLSPLFYSYLKHASHTQTSHHILGILCFWTTSCELCPRRPQITTTSPIISSLLLFCTFSNMKGQCVLCPEQQQTAVDWMPIRCNPANMGVGWPYPAQVAG